MKLRVLDILLLIVVAIGGVFVVKTGHEHSRLTAQYARLAGITGDLRITDPSKLHIQALATSDPMHFAWRMYYPPNYTQKIFGGGFGSSSTPSAAKEFIGRIRFRADGRGNLDCYTHFDGGSSRGSYVSGKLAELATDRWNELQVEQLGSKGLAVVDPSETVSLLQIKLPDAFQAAASRELGSPIPSRFVPVFYEVKIGPKAGTP